MRVGDWKQGKLHGEFITFNSRGHRAMERYVEGKLMDINGVPISVIEGPFQVTVKNLRRKTYVLDVRSSDTIEDVKWRLLGFFGYISEIYHLCHHKDREIMSNKKTLGEYLV